MRKFSRTIRRHVYKHIRLWLNANLLVEAGGLQEMLPQIHTVLFLLYRARRSFVLPKTVRVFIWHVLALFYQLYVYPI